MAMYSLAMYTVEIYLCVKIFFPGLLQVGIAIKTKLLYSKPLLLANL